MDEGGVPTRPVNSVQRQLADADGRVLQIAATKWLASLPGIRGLPQPTVWAAAILGVIPLLSAALESVGGSGVGWFIWMTAFIYGGLIVLMLVGATYSWPRVIALGGGIDSILDGDDRVTVSRSLDHALGSAIQATLFGLGIVCSASVGILLSDPLGSYVGGAGLAYGLTVSWTGGVGALTVYWLWGAPALLYPLARVERPRLDWVAPQQTPAVQEASRLMIDSSRFAAVGLLLFSIPIALTLALASRDWSVWVLSVSPVIFSLITVLSCSLLPQVALENLIRRSKQNSLRVSGALLPELSDLKTPTQEVLAAIELHERIANSPVSIVDWKRLLEYCFLLLSSAVPVAIALLSS